MSEAPVQITAHGEGWHDIPYIRADVAAAQLAERDARIAELEAALLSAKGLMHYIGNPSAWENYDDTVSEAMRDALNLA